MLPFKIFKICAHKKTVTVFRLVALFMNLMSVDSIQRFCYALRHQLNSIMGCDFHRTIGK